MLEQTSIPGTPPAREDPAELCGDMVTVRAQVPADYCDRIAAWAGDHGILFTVGAGELLVIGLSVVDAARDAFAEVAGFRAVVDMVEAGQ